MEKEYVFMKLSAVQYHMLQGVMQIVEATWSL